MTIIGEIGPDKTREIMGEQDLVESVYDAVAASRNSIRVRPHGKGGRTFMCSLMMITEPKLYEQLCAEAKKQQRSVDALLRRYLMLCFRDCIEVERPAA
jgi:hypothetical protein